MSVSSLVTTPGASNANAYVSLAVADQYQEDRPAPNSTWADATDDEKAQAILWATKLLDALWDWTGAVVSEDQALLWPRYGMTHRNGYTVDYETIPTELQLACAEYARQLMDSDRSADSDVETQGIVALSAGPVSLTFKDSVTAKVVPDAVFHLIPSEWGKPRGRAAGMTDTIRW